MARLFGKHMAVAGGKNDFEIWPAFRNVPGKLEAVHAGHYHAMQARILDGLLWGLLHNLARQHIRPMRRYIHLGVVEAFQEWSA
jgi:hypothetical protein